jgi:Flp pilus assembly protein TadD
MMDAVDTIYARLQQGSLTYYELLAIHQTATTREIEAAYAAFCARFSSERIAAIADATQRDQAAFIARTGARAYSVLHDFVQRVAYEKKGFREGAPETREEEPGEKAKNIYKKAKVLYQQREFRKGITAMEEAISLDPHAASYHLLLGMCQANIRDLHRQAEQTLLKAAELESWNAEPYVALGMLFYAERLPQKAEGYFRKALSLEGDHTLARKKLEEIAGPDRAPTLGDSLKGAFSNLFARKK